MHLSAQIHDFILRGSRLRYFENPEHLYVSLRDDTSYKGVVEG